MVGGRAAGRHRGRWAVPLALMLAAAALAHGSGAGARAQGEPAAAEAAGGKKPRSVRVATTGNGSEMVKTLPITRERAAGKRVVMSLKPGSLPGLRRGDRLLVSAELQVTVNCFFRSPRCVGKIYRYNPTVSAKLVLARSRHATGGPGALQIGRPRRDVCTQRHPDREHHCVLVFPGSGLTIPNPGELPCSLRSCHLNLVAGAHHRRARPGEVVLVGGNRPDGSIPQDRGRINVVRFRRARDPQFPTTATRRRRHAHLPPDFQRRVVYSKRLRGLEEGEQLSVQARMRTAIRHLPYAVRTSARLILASRPNDPRQGEFVKRVADLNGEIAESNGFNCTQDKRTCLTRKVGVLEMLRDAVGPRGKRKPLYANLVTVLGPKVLRAQPGDRVRLRKGGGIRVTRYPPELNR